jgi:type IV pilus assembly protein PilO
MAGLSIAKLPWKAQLGLFVALSVAGAGAFYYFFEMPTQAAMSTQEQELEKVRQRINRGLDAARELPKFRAEIDGLMAELERLKPILPEEKDVADLLRHIQTLATQSNLTIRSFKPQPVATREMHAEWPISLEIEGTYHNLGLFLDRVSKFPRIINVGKLDIKAKQAPELNATIDVQFTATTFVLLNEAEQQQQQPKKGAAAKTPKKTE